MPSPDAQYSEGIQAALPTSIWQSLLRANGIGIPLEIPGRFPFENSRENQIVR